MKKKVIAGNLGFAFAAQGVSYLTSALTSLVVPKLLGIEQFGYWQLFLLYASYAGLADLGISEGIYLRYGGACREDVDSKSLSNQYRIYSVIQLFFCFGLMLFSLTFKETDRAFVTACTAVYLFVVNLASYMYYLLQAINETRKYSTAIILSKILFAAFLLPLLLLRVHSFKPYLATYCIAHIASLVYCAYHCRDLIFRSGHICASGLDDVFNSIKVGYKLLIANLTSTLLVGVCRMMVDSVWSIETFGQLSLAFTLCNFFMQCVYQFSMVLFPALRQLDASGRGRFYEAAQTVLNVLLPLSYICYFPIAMFIEYWLPSYTSVTLYFAMLLPICIFDGRMDILGNTFLKVLRKEKLLMQINLISVALGSVALYFSAFICKDINLVIWVLVSAIFIRCFICEIYISKQMSVPLTIRSCSSVFVTIVFLVLIQNGLTPIALMLTCASNLISSLANRSEIRKANDVIRG
mgnify:FL=1